MGISVGTCARRQADDRWTHFYNGASTNEEAYRQLDYLLLSASLAAANPGAPDIVRDGMPFRAERYTGHRFDGIGENEPKASDHCPVVMPLEV